MSYDDKQEAAVRVTCVKCRKDFHATHPTTPYLCPACRPWKGCRG